MGEDGRRHRVYLEHFAVNEQGHCPRWFSAEEEQKYIEGIDWKRNVHKVHRTILLETRSADFHNENVFLKLERQLHSLGIRTDNGRSNDLSREIARQEQSILDMLTSFNFLLRSRVNQLSSCAAK